jgi:hypothetical protein
MEHKAESETNSNGITEASLSTLQWGFYNSYCTFSVSPFAGSNPLDESA